MAISQKKWFFCPFFNSNAIFCTFPFQAFCNLHSVLSLPCTAHWQMYCRAKTNTVQATNTKVQSEKSANSRKVIAVKIAAYTSQLVQTNISWLQPEREVGWSRRRSQKKRLIYRSLAIAPHYFQRRPFFAHYHILLTFDIIRHTHTSTNNVTNVKN